MNTTVSTWLFFLSGIPCLMAGFILAASIFEDNEMGQKWGIVFSIGAYFGAYAIAYAIFGQYETFYWTKPNEFSHEVPWTIFIVSVCFAVLAYLLGRYLVKIAYENSDEKRELDEKIAAEKQLEEDVIKRTEITAQIEHDTNRKNITEALSGIRASARLLKGDESDEMIMQSIDDLITELKQEVSSNPSVLEDQIISSELSLILNQLSLKGYKDDIVTQRLLVLIDDSQ